MHLAAAVRANDIADEAKVQAHFAEAHPGESTCDCMTIDHVAWWQNPATAQPVIDQLKRCLAVLESTDG